MDHHREQEDSLLSPGARAVGGDEVEEDDLRGSLNVIRLRHGTIGSSIANLIISACGCGVLTLPFALKCGGWLLGTFLLTLAAISTYLSLQALAQCTHWLTAAAAKRPYTGMIQDVHRDDEEPQTVLQLSYSEVARILAPEKWKRTAVFLVDINLFLFLIGATIIALILIADFVEHAVDGMTSKSADGAVHGLLFDVAHSRLGVLTIAGIIMLFPMLLDNLHALRHTSSVAMVLIMYLLIAWVVKMARRESDSSVPNTAVTVAANWGLQTFYSFGIQGISFCCQFNLIPLQCELKKPTLKNMQIISGVTVFVCWLVYNLFGLVGYFLFGEDTTGNLLNNFAEDDVLMNVGRITLALLMLCKLPLILVPLRMMLTVTLRSLISSCFQQENHHRQGDKKWILIQLLQRAFVSVVILVSMIIVTLKLPHVEVMYSILGGTCACMVCFVLPGGLLYFAARRRHLDERLISRAEFRRHVFISSFLCAYGLTVCIASLLSISTQ